MYIYVYTNLPINTMVTLSHRWCQGQEIFLASFAEKQNRNYDTEC